MHGNYAYDGSTAASNGNVKDDGRRTYQYDALNRLVRVFRKEDSMVIAEYRYDALGRRVSRYVANGGLTENITDGFTFFFYLGQQCLEERRDSATAGPSKQYVWGNYVDELCQMRVFTPYGPRNYYPLSDLSYRTTALTDDFGCIVDAYDTDAYGRTLIFRDPGDDGRWFTDEDERTDEPLCEFIFTGRRFDPETQLYYYRARCYDPVTGRFLSRDPLNYYDGMNLYEYVGGNPIVEFDPSGLAAPVVLLHAARVVAAHTARAGTFAAAETGIEYALVKALGSCEDVANFSWGWTFGKNALFNLIPGGAIVKYAGKAGKVAKYIAKYAGCHWLLGSQCLATGGPPDNRPSRGVPERWRQRPDQQ